MQQRMIETFLEVIIHIYLLVILKSSLIFFNLIDNDFPFLILIVLSKHVSIFIFGQKQNKTQTKISDAC
jgi:hypothetical protein